MPEQQLKEIEPPLESKISPSPTVEEITNEPEQNTETVQQENETEE